MNREATVTTQIGWLQAKRAVERIAAIGDVERFTLDDVRDLHAIAEHLDRRITEAKTYASQHRCVK